MEQVIEGAQGEGHRGEGGAGRLKEEAVSRGTLGGVKEGGFISEGHSGLGRGRREERWGKRRQKLKEALGGPTP